MGYEDDRYVDEDGEPLMDPYAADDDDRRDASPEPPLFDDFADEEDESAWRRDRSPTPALDSDKSGSKPRKRLLKKGAGSGGGGGGGDEDGIGIGDDLNDWGDDVAVEEKGRREKGKGQMGRKLVAMAKGGKEGSGSGSGKKRKERMEGDGRVERSAEKARMGMGRMRYDGGAGSDDEGEREIQELWATITGDSEVYGYNAIVWTVLLFNCKGKCEVFHVRRCRMDAFGHDGIR